MEDNMEDRYAAYKGYFEVSFIDMINVVCRREYFAFINIVNFNRF